MHEIDIQHWHRKEHFEFFSHIAFPFYSLTIDLDVTAFHRYVKAHQTSFYYGLIYQCCKAMNQIEAFRYRIRGEKIFLIDELIPSFTDIKKDSDLFLIANVKLVGQMHEFSDACKSAVLKQKQYFPSKEDEKKDHYIYFSSVPWIHFTSVTHEMDINKDDSIARITFGKYEKRDDRLMMPLSIQVNHRLIDGIHVAQFIHLLEEAFHKLK